jgi:predicted nucleotidyltransferase
MISEIEQHRREIEALCREYGIQRLAVFGSAATGGPNLEVVSVWL